jgi:hypothetical protein
MQPKFDKKIKFLFSILDTMEWLKNPSHATVPLKTGKMTSARPILFFW